MRECNLNKKNENLGKIGGGLPEYKKVFLVILLVLVVLFFVSLYFCAFVWYKIAKMAIFLQFPRLFIYFVPPKGLSSDVSFLPILLFLLLSSFQKSIFFLCFLSINPFLERLFVGVSFVFLLLAFSFPNVCLLIWNKLP